jgi:predicted phage-related endonuclease
VTLSYPITSDEQWRELRRRHVGGSEVAALFDEHPRLTRFELWHRKKGNVPEPDFTGDNRVFWGATLEPAIAMGVAKLQGWNVRKVRRYFLSPLVVIGAEEFGLGGSLDYEIVSNERGPGVLEIKTADWLVARNWEDGQPPLEYELQLQTYLELTERAWGAIAALIGGNDLRVFLYERRPKIGNYILQKTEEFWQSVRLGEPPKPDFQLDAETIGAIYGASAPGKELDLTGDNRLPELISLYRLGLDYERQGKGLKAAAKAEMLEKVRDAEVVRCGADRITLKQVAATQVAYERKAYRDFRLYPTKPKDVSA